MPPARCLCAPTTIFATLEIEFLKTGGPAGEEMYKILILDQDHTGIFNGHGENQRTIILPPKNALTYMALLREYHISDMFSRDCKITLKGNQYTEDQVRTPSPKNLNPHCDIKFRSGSSPQRCMMDPSTPLRLAKFIPPKRHL